MRTLLLLVAVVACSDTQEPAVQRPRVRGEGEPRRVAIERILISYRGNPFEIPARRTLEEAQRVARQVLRRAQAGENFVALRDGYSDDREPGAQTANGPYFFCNYGIDPDPTRPQVPRMLRANMGRRLGDAAFKMQQGEIALIEYDAQDYSAGFEVIRLIVRDDRTEEQVERDLSGARRTSDGGR